MKNSKKIIAISLSAMVTLMSLGNSVAYASEITGTISSSTSSGSQVQGTVGGSTGSSISGTVGGGTGGSTVSGTVGGGGGGGGASTIPLAGTVTPGGGSGGAGVSNNPPGSVLGASTVLGDPNAPGLPNSGLHSDSQANPSWVLLLGAFVGAMAPLAIVFRRKRI